MRKKLTLFVADIFKDLEYGGMVFNKCIYAKCYKEAEKIAAHIADDNGKVISLRLNRKDSLALLGIR